MKLRANVFAACVLLLSTAARNGRAQGQSVAESLFREGRELYKQGKFDDACTKLAESQKQDSALGTLILLASCHEKQGKIASAWGEYQDASVQASRQGQVDRETYAQEHAAELEPRLHHLKLRVASPMKDQEIVIDDRPIGPAAWGTSLPIDPGRHVVTAKAPGRKTWRHEIVVADDPNEDALDVPALVIDPDANKRLETRLVVADPAQRRTVGYALGGAGILAISGGVLLMLRARSLSDEANGLAESGDQSANAKYDDALVSQTFAFITGGLGIVSLGTGAYLVLSSGSSRKPTTTGKSVTPLLGAGYAGVRGTF